MNTRAHKRAIEAAGATDEDTLRELGARLARQRLRGNRTQAALAEEAGVSLATVKRLEAGRSTQLANLVRVLRALGLLARLVELAPEESVRPMELVEQEAPRRRASRRAKRVAKKRDSGTAWTWGEDR